MEAAVLELLGALAQDEALLESIVQEGNQRISVNSPAKRKELEVVRARVVRLETQQATPMDRRMDPDIQVPKSIWPEANEREADVEAAQAEVDRLEQELDELKASRLRAESYRAALAQLSPG